MESSSSSSLMLLVVGLAAAGLLAWLVLRKRDGLGMRSCSAGGLGSGMEGAEYMASRPAPGWGLQDKSLRCSGGPKCGETPAFS